MTTDIEASDVPEKRALAFVRPVLWVLAAAYFLAAVAIVSLRYFVLPNIDGYRDDIAAAVSRGVGTRVTIGTIDANWRGLHPYLLLRDVEVHDRSGKAALTLPAIEASVGWRSLLALQVRFHSLAFERPDLTVRRDAAGIVSVAGIELRDSGGGGGGLAEWVLAQGEVVISGGRIEWIDELRGAPPLVLAGVDLRLLNGLEGHRFALRAHPEGELAGPVDVRGEFAGGGIAHLDRWRGQLYAELEYADLAAWKAWLDYPVSIERGAGSVRVWATFRDAKLADLVADVALQDVAGRLAGDLPLLELESLAGRLGLREARRGTGFFAFLRREEPAFEAFGRGLAFRLRGDPVPRPTDFSLRWEPLEGASDGKGEFKASILELAPLAALAERLPFPGAVRRALAEASPEGTVRELHFAWQGPIDEPVRYAAHGRFEALGLAAHGDVPGFVGLSGNFGVNERGGSVGFSGTNARLDAPDLMPFGPLDFDRLASRITWSLARGHLELKVEDASFSNAEIEGTASAVYRDYTVPGGGIDLTILASRADGRAAYRYIPDLGPETARFLRDAIGKAAASDVRVRLKGDMRNFPFDDPAKGLFEVALKVKDGVFAFDEHWPRIEGIDADLLLNGRRLDIRASKGTTGGARLENVRATIPDVFADRTVVRIDGRAEGETADFLRYVVATPVNDAIGGFVEDASAEGGGRLALKLELPLETMDRMRIDGSFEFLSNTIRLDPAMPPLGGVTGVLAFTDRGVTARDINARLLGGPVAIDVATRERRVTATARGTAHAEGLAEVVGPRLGSRLSGSAPYRLSATARGKLVDLVVESDLSGLGIDLPAPLGKKAPEVWPTRFERTVAGPDSPGGRTDQVSLDMGQVLGVRAQLRPEGAGMAVERAAISLGGTGVALPGQSGIYVAGSVKTLDLDGFLPLLKAGTDSSGGAKLTALNVKAGTLVALGKMFHDVSVKAQITGSRWRASVVSRELAGEVAWLPEGRGSVVARLKTLTYPESAPNPPAAEVLAAELPALDVVAESFTLQGHPLGRLDLLAVSEASGWRIERGTLEAPEGVARVDGLVEAGVAGRPRTSLGFTVDVKDVGGYLSRIGFPDTVAKGTANLSGQLSWQGPIYSIDYPSLTGNVKLAAEKGQFLKIDPGAAKLLGVLSLQSLPRRITLDFRDVFTEGFAFDTITSTGMVARGVISTNDFVMVGPAASVTLRGTMDLARETQDLRVRVIPTIGESIAAAAGLALVNPLIGLGALAAQKILKDPIGQALAYEYHITGGWTDPRVERLRAQAPGPGPIPGS